MRSPIGIRIRRKRIAEGLSQTALARALGISPSYLNLIENNKRTIGGTLLIRISERLGIDLALLSGESEARAIAIIGEMLSDPVLRDVELSSEEIHALVARFPEAAIALVRLYRAHLDAGAEIESLRHRLRSDPLLAELLHEMLNRITGMKSGTEILTGIPDLTEEEKSRFLATINAEAQELAATARNLVAHFERSPSRQRPLSPLAELDEAFIAEANHFPQLEEAAEELRREVCVRPGQELDEASLSFRLEQRFGIRIRDLPDRPGQMHPRFDAASHTLWMSALARPSTRVFLAARTYAAEAAPSAIDEVALKMKLGLEESLRLARRALSAYVAGAMMMPYRRFLHDAEERHYDIDLLASHYRTSFEQTAHRLTCLRRRGEEGVPFGFLRADMTGRLTKRLPLPGLALPTSGHGCLLWPLYEAFSKPGVVRQISEFPGGRFLTIARAETKGVHGFSAKPLTYSIMLACDVLHADRTVYGRGIDLHAASVPVGPSCLLCSRQCAYRQETPT